MAFRNSNGHAKEFLRNLYTVWAHELKNVRQPCCIDRWEKNERSLVLQLVEKQEAGWKRVSVNQERILLVCGRR